MGAGNAPMDPENWVKQISLASQLKSFSSLQSVPFLKIIPDSKHENTRICCESTDIYTSEESEPTT